MKNKEIEKLKKKWRLFWGEAPEHSLKSRKGYDIEDFWLTEFSKSLQEKIEKINEYTEHRPECIRSSFEAGRPTKKGGYEQQFGSKWYESRPIDKTPKCDCGLDEVLNILQPNEDKV